MKEWKSRIGVDPPPQFFADVIAYLEKAFPGAALDRETVRALRPYLVSQWRAGQNAPKAAAATCSCDGSTIFPSPASQISLPKRAALAPKGANRTTVFGAEDLREPGQLPRVRIQHAIAQKQLAHFSQERDRLASGGKTGKKAEALLAKASRQVEEWGAKATALQERVTSLVADAPWSRGLAPADGTPALDADRVRPARRTKVSPSDKPRPAGKPPRPRANAAQLNPAEGAQPKKKPCRDCKPQKAPAPIPSENQATLEALVAEFAGSAADDLEKTGE